MSVAFPELASLRLGFGLSPLHPPPPDDAAVLADVAATAALPPAYTREEATALHIRFGEAAGRKHKEKRAGSPGDLEVEEVRAEISRQKAAIVQTRMAICVGAPIGFGERLINFWSNHFTVAIRTVQLQPLVWSFIEEPIRQNIGTTFLELFTAAETHPAMLTYLDQVASAGDRSIRAVRSKGKAGLNENLAREMLELHSVGVGSGYTQDDVRQLANLLTGLSYDPRNPEKEFFPDRAQPGAETVLGKSYGGGRRDGLDAIKEAFRDICSRPDTARFICTKLATHFVSDTPGTELVERMVSAWGQDGDLPAIYAAMIGHPDLEAQARQKVRQPFDFIAAGFRALGFDREAIEALPPKLAHRWIRVRLADMGQSWLDAPGPDGWDERGTTWINPQLLAERIDWAMSAPTELMKTLPDGRQFLSAALGGTGGQALTDAIPRAESSRDAIGIVLASNDFNRR